MKLTLELLSTIDPKIDSILTHSVRVMPFALRKCLNSQQCFTSIHFSEFDDKIG